MYLLRGKTGLPSFCPPYAVLICTRLGLAATVFATCAESFALKQPGSVQRSPCLPRSSPKSSLLWPVRLGQSAQLPAVGTSCASRLSKGASFRMSRTFVSIQNCRLRTGRRMRVGLLARCCMLP